MGRAVNGMDLTFTSKCYGLKGSAAIEEKLR